jgi:enterochelin esterase-like enzyme
MIVNAVIGNIHLIGGWLPIVVNSATIVVTIALVAVVLLSASRRRAGQATPDRRTALRRAGILAVSAGAGAGIGLLLSWLLSDQLNLFDVSLTPISRGWVSGAFAAVAVGLASLLLRERRRAGTRRVLATAVVVTALLAGTLGVNADFGQYTTIGSLTDASVAPPLSTVLLSQQRAGAPGRERAAAAGARSLWKDAIAVGMPSHGVVGSVTIPATVSHFAARAAYVYLPPAALVPHPVALPVLIMMSGQPGSPSNVIESGQIPAILDAFAAAHNGLAPIVVVPDQLGAPTLNPMCVNGALGASATYLTVDVPNWIRSHLTVETSPDAWAIGGFSQGGTCSIQLGAAHPELFSAIVDVSGQLAPKNGGKVQTIALGFGGSAAAYQAGLPESILAANAPYHRMVAVFGVGQLDSRYGPVAKQMTAAATSAGIQATLAVSPGTGHDWHTVQWVLQNALDPVYARLGLVRPS